MALRTWTNEQLIEAIPHCTSWSQVCECLGLRPNHSIARLRATAEELGLDVSKFYNRHKVAEFVEHPFSNEGSDENLRNAGIGIATAWFLRRGYMASIPVEQAPYDLVVESDKGLQRVQIKTATGKKNGAGRQVNLGRHLYDPNTGGNQHACYQLGEVDVFFIVTIDRRIYVIPLEVVLGTRLITLDKKYAAFEVSTGSGAAW